MRLIVAKTTTPMSICCQNDETLRITNPFCSVAINTAPNKVPDILTPIFDYNKLIVCFKRGATQL